MDENDQTEKTAEADEWKQRHEERLARINTRDAFPIWGIGGAAILGALAWWVHVGFSWIALPVCLILLWRMAISAIEDAVRSGARAAITDVTGFVDWNQIQDPVEEATKEALKDYFVLEGIKDAQKEVVEEVIESALRRNREELTEIIRDGVAEALDERQTRGV